MPGEVSAGDQNAELYPLDYNPAIEQIRGINNAVELLQRIALALDNRRADRTIIWPLVPSKQDGTDASGIYIAAMNTQGRPQIRGQRLVFVPLGTGEPVIQVAGTDLLHTSIVIFPSIQDFPWPRTWQVGESIHLYDATALTTVPDFTAYIVGTTE